MGFVRLAAFIASALGHGIAAYALLQFPMALPPEPPVLMDLVMAMPQPAETAATPEPEAAGPASGEHVVASAAPPEATPAAAAPAETSPVSPPTLATEPAETALAEALPEPPATEAAEPPPALPPRPPPVTPPVPPLWAQAASRPAARPAAPVVPASPSAGSVPATAAAHGPMAAAPPPTWLGEISAALARNRTYPPRLRAERVTGVVVLRFTVDRGGRVLARAIERSSGSAELDRLALELLGRADPLPAPPADLPGTGTGIELVVPIRYSIR